MDLGEGLQQELRDAVFWKPERSITPVRVLEDMIWFWVQPFSPFRFLTIETSQSGRYSGVDEDGFEGNSGAKRWQAGPARLL